MTIGEKIKAARLQAGLSPKELAAKSGLNLRSIYDWEEGVRVPRSVDTVLCLTGALEIPGLDLLEDWDRKLMLGAYTPAGEIEGEGECV